MVPYHPSAPEILETSAVQGRLLKGSQFALNGGWSSNIKMTTKFENRRKVSKASLINFYDMFWSLGVFPAFVRSRNILLQCENLYFHFGIASLKGLGHEIEFKILTKMYNSGSK